MKHITESYQILYNLKSKDHHWAYRPLIANRAYIVNGMGWEDIDDKYSFYPFDIH